jgi:hypothetical protein
VKRRLVVGVLTGLMLVSTAVPAMAALDEEYRAPVTPGPGACFDVIIPATASDNANPCPSYIRK